MARIRSIHPGFFTDEAIISISFTARYLLIGLWTEADDAGVFEWKPRRFKLRILPADDANAAELLEEIRSQNIVAKFVVDGVEYGAIRNFCKWQRPRNPEFIHPRGDMDEYLGMPARAARDQTERGTALGKILAERQDHCCAYCGNGITAYRKKVNSLDVDHVIPVSRGGSDDVENLAAACKPCNQLKANMTADELRARFAKAELHKNSVSRIGLHHSQDAKSASQSAKPPNDASPPQREDGGDKMEDGGGVKKEPPNPQAAADIDFAVSTWNDTAKHCGLPRAQNITDKRRKAILLRLKDVGGFDGWCALMEKIRGSPFLRGANQQGWRCDFDWVLKPANLTKIMEGNYDDRKPAGGIQNAIDDLRRGV